MFKLVHKDCSVDFSELLIGDKFKPTNRDQAYIKIHPFTGCNAIRIDDKGMSFFSDIIKVVPLSHSMNVEATIKHEINRY